MQVTDEKKRANILTAAARLFASQPFHKVLLSDVAEAASVGKGTLYTYFKNKEDLFFSLLYSGFSRLVERLKQEMDKDDHGPVENLELVIRETVRFAYQAPHLFELMRTIPGWKADDRAKWDEKRKEFKIMIESVIRQGVDTGVFQDTHPELTARYIPGFVRSALLDGVDKFEADVLTDHISRFVLSAITAKDKAC